MRRDFKVYLEDVLEAARKIDNYTIGLTLETFSQDAKTIDAVVRNLEVIGEAIKRVPENIRLKYPAVEWKKIAGLQDILIHDYFGIDVEIIWDIIQNKLPVLKKEIEHIVGEI
jgi:uncharacterized protein with HEPN domain